MWYVCKLLTLKIDFWKKNCCKNLLPPTFLRYLKGIFNKWKLLRFIMDVITPLIKYYHSSKRKNGYNDLEKNHLLHLVQMLWFIIVNILLPFRQFLIKLLDLSQNYIPTYTTTVWVYAYFKSLLYYKFQVHYVSTITNYSFIKNCCKSYETICIIVKFLQSFITKYILIIYIKKNNKIYQTV